MVWRTGLSGAPGWINSNSLPSGFWKIPSAIIHRTVRCASGATATAQRSTPTETCKSATVHGQCAQSQSRRQKAHRTVNNTCLVHHRIVRWPHLSEFQRSNPNGWVTWLAHRIVRCTHRQTVFPLLKICLFKTHILRQILVHFISASFIIWRGVS